MPKIDSPSDVSQQEEILGKMGISGPEARRLLKESPSLVPLHPDLIAELEIYRTLVANTRLKLHLRSCYGWDILHLSSWF